MGWSTERRYRCRRELDLSRATLLRLLRDGAALGRAPRLHLRHALATAGMRGSRRRPPAAPTPRGVGSRCGHQQANDKDSHSVQSDSSREHSARAAPRTTRCISDEFRPIVSEIRGTVRIPSDRCGIFPVDRPGAGRSRQLRGETLEGNPAAVIAAAIAFEVVCEGSNLTVAVPPLRSTSTSCTPFTRLAAPRTAAAQELHRMPSTRMTHTS